MKERNCIVCGRVVKHGSNICSAKCLQGKNKGEYKQGKVIKSPTSLESIFKGFNKNFKAIDIIQEVSMVILKHTTLKNKNISCAGINFSFDKDGIAKFPKLEPAFSAASLLVKFSKGSISFIEKEDRTKEEVETLREKAKENVLLKIVEDQKNYKKEKEPDVSKKSEPEKDRKVEVLVKKEEKIEEPLKALDKKKKLVKKKPVKKKLVKKSKTLGKKKKSVKKSDKE
jgi:hypothetical protein